MTEKPKYYLLKKHFFLLGLLILIFNDFYLKYAFSNFVTGKLSDFAGLFIFPYFISIFFEKNASKIYFLTSVIFTLWKFEISQPFIDWISNYTNLAFYRTIDITDLIALTILPFSYLYFKRKLTEIENTNTVFNSAIGILCMFIFVADSNPRQSFILKNISNKKYEISLNKDSIFQKSDFRGEYDKNRTDNSFSFCFEIPEYNAQVTAITTVQKTTNNITTIKLDSITEIEVYGKLFIGIKQSNIDNCKKLTPEDLEKYFQLNCINYLTSNTESIEKPYYVYYSNDYK
ncbi:hypothetical protein [Flavobacterium frigoris]|uniref:Uncharacterized protein n=1 Tax=Flavobacterium frigoris TaxID=229204 RepID=A0A1H9S5D6_FLAFI|nr:hypothetical protein [Flavobacterium frigoris]SER80194.1 hypothetical protein SAMN05444355_1451 [Flavobacterium frigoris]